jgi:hypothetical protein
MSQQQMQQQPPVSNRQDDIADQYMNEKFGDGNAVP